MKKVGSCNCFPSHPYVDPLTQFHILSAVHFCVIVNMLWPSALYPNELNSIV